MGMVAREGFLSWMGRDGDCMSGCCGVSCGGERTADENSGWGWPGLFYTQGRSSELYSSPADFVYAFFRPPPAKLSGGPLPKLYTMPNVLLHFGRVEGSPKYSQV